MTAAGWYKDPDGTPRLRWWDGQNWTTNTVTETATTEAGGAQTSNLDEEAVQEEEETSNSSGAPSVPPPSLGWTPSAPKTGGDLTWEGPALGEVGYAPVPPLPPGQAHLGEEAKPAGNKKPLIIIGGAILLIVAILVVALILSVRNTSKEADAQVASLQYQALAKTLQAQAAIDYIVPAGIGKTEIAALSAVQELGTMDSIQDATIDENGEVWVQTGAYVCRGITLNLTKPGEATGEVTCTEESEIPQAGSGNPDPASSDGEEGALPAEDLLTVADGKERAEALMAEVQLTVEAAVVAGLGVPQETAEIEPFLTSNLRPGDEVKICYSDDETRFSVIGIFDGKVYNWDPDNKEAIVLKKYDTLPDCTKSTFPKNGPLITG